MADKKCKYRVFFDDFNIVVEDKRELNQLIDAFKKKGTLSLKSMIVNLGIQESMRWEEEK